MGEIDLVRQPSMDGKAVLKGCCCMELFQKLLVRTWKDSSSKQ